MNLVEHLVEATKGEPAKISTRPIVKKSQKRLCNANFYTTVMCYINRTVEKAYVGKGRHACMNYAQKLFIFQGGVGDGVRVCIQQYVTRVNLRQ